MALPPGWPTVTVSGTYLRIDGTPAVGSVWFETAQPCVIADVTGTVIGVLPRRQIATLDTTGSFTIDLPCTDEGGTPTGWTYQVQEKWDAGQPPYSIEVPVAMQAEGINLPTYPHATPVPVNPPVVTYLRTSDIGTLVASQTDMANAIATANNASNQAAAAVTTANTAMTTANDAASTANGIAGTANTALTNANAAVTTANAASATANAIAGTANTALTNANAAVTTANNAAADASTALTTASGIAGTANTALVNSASAVATASAANTTAGNAQTAAAAAQTTANTGVTNAAAAQTTANTAVTNAAAAQTTANTAVTNAAAAQTSANNALGLLDGLEDYIINGNMDFWQRATSYAAFNAANKFAADRFGATAAGTTIAVSQQSFTPGQTAVPNGPSFFLRHVTASTAGASNFGIFFHKIEGVERFSGKTVVLSFWMKADAARTIGLELQMGFGSTGSAAVNGAVIGSVNLTTAWQQFTWTITVPSTAGKTISGGGDCIVFNWWLDGGSSFTSRGAQGQQSGTFDIAQVSCKPSGTTTGWRRRPLGLELLLCQRYFEKSYDQGVLPGTVTMVGTLQLSIQGLPSNSYETITTTPYKVTKRAIPTVNIYSPNSGASGKVYSASNSADVAAGVLINGTTGCSITALMSAASTAIDMRYQWTADCEI